MSEKNMTGLRNVIFNDGYYDNDGVWRQHESDDLSIGEVSNQERIEIAKAEIERQRQQDLKAFTMAAMQGLMSHNAAYWPTNEIAERAIKTAMATLEALEKVK